MESSQETFTTLPDRGYYVLTVAGADQAPFTFEAVVNGQRRELHVLVYTDNHQLQDCSVTFEPDAVVGTFRSPIILTDNIDYAIVGIDSVITTIDPDGAERWFDLNGRQLEGKPSTKGVYLRKQGEKTHKEFVK